MFPDLLFKKETFKIGQQIKNICFLFAYISTFLAVELATAFNELPLPGINLTRI